MIDKKTIISVEDLHVKFTLRGSVLNVIRGISLDIHQGESIAIVGESGSGKSVFTKTFLGMLDSNGYIDKGKIFFRTDDSGSEESIVDLAQFKTEKRMARYQRQTDCYGYAGSDDQFEPAENHRRSA